MKFGLLPFQNENKINIPWVIPHISKFWIVNLMFLSWQILVDDFCWSTDFNVLHLQFLFVYAIINPKSNNFLFCMRQKMRLLFIKHIWIARSTQKPQFFMIFYAIYKLHLSKFVSTTFNMFCYSFRYTFLFFIIIDKK